MKISDAGLDLVKSFEGYHRKLPNGDCTTYLCPAGVPTIGWGNTEGIKMGMVWTREQAEEGLRREIAKFEAAVGRLVTVDLNQHQFDACVSLAYNIGIQGFAGSSVLRYINRGDMKAAASYFRLWNKARDPKTNKLVVLNGLVDRRAREATLFLTPVEEPEEPSMPQAVVESAPKLGWKAWLGIGAVGGGGTQIVPAPPAEVTETVTSLTAWQSIIGTGQSVVMFGWSNWPWVLGFAATVAGLTYLHRRTAQ